MKNFKEIAIYVLSVVIIAGFFVLLYLLLTRSVPVENKDLLNTSIGALLTAVVTIIQWHFGSSKSSQDKTELLKPKQ